MFYQYHNEYVYSNEASCTLILAGIQLQIHIIMLLFGLMTNKHRQTSLLNNFLNYKDDVLIIAYTFEAKLF